MDQSKAVKVCRGCGLWLYLDCYSLDGGRPASRCRPCYREKDRARVRDPEKSREAAKRWRERHPELYRERIKDWERRNPHALCAKAAKRRAAKLRACPSWADHDAIAAVYAEAQRISEETGIPHDVDHFEPLQGKDVCGLHVHYNLRVIPASENRSKGNKRVAPAA